jgi:hypothetical protein
MMVRPEMTTVKHSAGLMVGLAPARTKRLYYHDRAKLLSVLIKKLSHPRINSSR